MKNKENNQIIDEFKEGKTSHQVWHKFSNWLVKTFGKDLHGEWEFIEGIGANGKKFKIKHRSFNELELSRRLVGYEVMRKVERYIKKYCPEIRIIRCDDSLYAGSDILLIPHPNHGITIIFIPQCTTIQNQFFLYKSHHNELVKALKEMSSVYSKNNF